ncbi:MAG TPA: hypothetical protein VGI10_23655 [Polyangiaceae bacterium]|jgi:hypothetical protein
MPVEYRALLPVSVLTASACLFGLAAPLACSSGNPRPVGSGGRGANNGGTNAGSSAAGANSGGVGTSGSGASGAANASGSGAANAGGASAGGASAAGGAGGASAAGGNAAGGNAGAAGGASGNAPGGASGNGSSGAGGDCNTLTIVPMPVTPTVLLLVDTSTSMFMGSVPWTPLYNALMDPNTGVVKPLQDKIRFGFTSYNSITQPSGDPTCPKLTSVPYALDNYDAINTEYKTIGAIYNGSQKWETPTGESVAAVAANLLAYDAMPPGPKYIVLVTDGNPDTCMQRDPQCGQDASIKAVQDAYAAGIGTFPIGIGDILTDNGGCSGRCGVLHLQDLANAGTGQPVLGSTANINDGCTPNGQKATYTTGAGGTAKYYTATNQTELQTALSGLLNAVASCSFAMNAYVTGDPSLGTVLVGTTPAVYNDPNGWRLESDTFTVTLLGSSCDTFKAGNANVDISFPCDPNVTVTGR